MANEESSEDKDNKGKARKTTKFLPMTNSSFQKDVVALHHLKFVRVILNGASKMVCSRDALNLNFKTEAIFYYQVRAKMKKNKSVPGSSFRLSLGERGVWDTNSPDHECDCPGPPPRFYLPPPPRPSPLGDSDCSENSVSHLEICEAEPVIDAEYHYRPAIPSLVIILIVAVVIVVFLLIGTFLVVLKKRKMQNSFPRKSSPKTHCDAISTNGIIYEDVTNIRSRTIDPHCSPGQTTLPPIEMIDVSSHFDHGVFTPVFICPASPVLDSYNSQELFNPIYEELSNGSGERGETDSEEIPRLGISEDEFAEDELSLTGDMDLTLKKGIRQGVGSLRGFISNNVYRDLDPSDADDRSKFLENSGKNLTQSSYHREKGKRTNGGSNFCGATKRPKSPDKKKIWKNKTPTLSASPVDCNEFHEGFPLKKILNIYPDVTGIGLQCSRRPSIVQRSLGENLCEKIAVFDVSHTCRTKLDIFTSFGGIQNSVKNQSQDSSLGSDSGYSNNTSGGKSSRALKGYAAPDCGDPVLS